jgi:hypothetical protein
MYSDIREKSHDNSSRAIPSPAGVFVSGALSNMRPHMAKVPACPMAQADRRIQLLEEAT